MKNNGILCVILSVIVSFTPALARKEKGPCFDSRYIELQSKQISEMTPQEYDYFKTMKEKCENYEKDRKFNPGKFWLWTGIIVLSIAIINAAASQ